MKETEYNQLYDHVLQIDMVSNERLLYRLTAEEAVSLMNRLHNQTDSSSEVEVGFWAFSDILDRMVMVRASEVRRFKFLPELKGSVGQHYYDNFKLLEVEPIDDPEEYIGPEIPSAVFKLRNSMQVYSFFLDPKHQCIGLDDVQLNNPVFRDNGFVHVADADGDENFIALHQVQLIELAREQVYADEIWERMQQMEEDETEGWEEE